MLFGFLFFCRQKDVLYFSGEKGTFNTDGTTESSTPATLNTSTTNGTAERFSVH